MKTIYTYRLHGLLITSIIILIIQVCGCALVKPTRHYEESTPVDRGLAGTYLSTAAVVAFDTTDNDSWGVYAGKRLTEYLTESKAFREVIYSKNDVTGAGYIITGSLDHLFFGGYEEPTAVILTVRVLSADRSRVLFQRTAKASSRMSAFHMTWLRSVPVSSPYVEEVLDSLLERIAKDIATRTNLPAVQNP